MNTDFLKLLYVIIVLDRVNTERISKTKCDVTSRLPSSHGGPSYHLHAMEIQRYTANKIIPLCLGTLISENFVLTVNSFCVLPALQYLKTELRIRIMKIQFHQYANYPIFNVKRLISHELYNYPNYDIGLIQMNETISYHHITSIMRPACIWAEPQLPTSDTYSIYEDLFGLPPGVAWTQAVIEPATIIGNDECSTIFEGFSSMIINSHIMCIKSNVHGMNGSPIIATVKNQTYVVGILSPISKTNNLSSFTWVIKIGNLIDWIESIVWPDAQVHSRCGQRIVKHKQLMTFSQTTYHGEFPWHVALYRMNRAGRQINPKYICGGTIINERTILTAAHCVNNEYGSISPERLTIVAGTYDLNEFTIDARNYSVKMVIVHEKYNRHFLENDIALLKLNDLIEFSNYIQPICIGYSPKYNSMVIGAVAGWGRDEHNEPAQVLRQANLPIQNNFDCRASNRVFMHTYLNDNNYCAGYGNGTNTCSGDSGGAMIFEIKSQWYIRGTVSVGAALPNSDRCDITKWVLFTDVPKFYDWILSN